MENVKKHREIKFGITEEKRIKLVSELNYHTTNLLAIEMKDKRKNEWNSILRHVNIRYKQNINDEFWYDYPKPKYKDKANLYYMNTDSFVIHIFTEEFFQDINNDVKMLRDGLINLTMIRMTKAHF